MDRPSTILIVDDEAVAREALAALLARSGYQLEFARDGREGLKLAGELRPDVILLDLMMPGMDGYEVCRRLRGSPAMAEVPVIMITALDDRESRLAGLAAGADDFLAKPFDRLELEIRLHTLRQVNRYRRLVDERDKLSQALTELDHKTARLDELSKQMINVQESERRRLAVDLHDEIGQALSGLRLLLQEESLDRARQAQARAVVDQLLERVREMALDLRPALLDDLGLFAALDWLFARVTRTTGVHIHHNVNALSEQRFDHEVETALFRVAQEALTNAARHAGVKEVSVTLNIEDHSIQLYVTDQGAGFDPAASRPVSTGLSGMEERVRLAGGSFELHSFPGEGTLVTAQFPLPTEVPA